MVHDNPEADDFELLRRARHGDSTAFHALIDRHAQRLYRLAVSLVGNAVDGEDVLQETFIGAFRGLKGFEGRSSVKTWLTRILVMQAAQFRRSRKRKQVEALPDAVAAKRDSQAGTEAGIDMGAALADLSAEHRQVLVLREYDGMSYEEIAQVLDIPRGTVESRLHRARGELRGRLRSYLP